MVLVDNPFDTTDNISYCTAKQGESSLILQPNIYGIGIDILKAVAWLKSMIKRKQ